MPLPAHKGRSVFAVLSVFMLFLVISGVVLIFRSDDIVFYLLRAGYGVNISPGEQKGNLLSGNHYSDTTLEFTGHDIIINIERSWVSVDWKRTFAERKICAGFRFEGITILNPGLGHEKVSTLDALALVPVNHNIRYVKITFAGIFTFDEFMIEDFKAVSRDLTVNGNCLFVPGDEELKLDMDLAVSPGLSEDLLGDFRGMLLSENDNGWFGSGISLLLDFKLKKYHISSDMIEINIRGE